VAAASPISVAALQATQTEVERCVLVAYDSKTHHLWERALA
jgi:hypothetical protein